MQNANEQRFANAFDAYREVVNPRMQMSTIIVNFIKIYSAWVVRRLCVTEPYGQKKNSKMLALNAHTAPNYRVPNTRPTST